MIDKFLSIPQATKLLKLSPKAVYGLIRGGKLTAYQVEGNMALLESDVRAWKRVPRDAAGRRYTGRRGRRPITKGEGE